MSQYINEAFKKFRLLEDYEEFSVTPEGLDNLGSFIGQALDDESVDVIDLEAEAQEDLKKSYIGKVICDCNICHSNIFFNKEDIVIDENGVANIDDECPYCMSNDGYTIIGEIQAYDPGLDVEIDTEVSDDELADEPIEIEVEDKDDVENADEVSKDETEELHESIEDVTINTEDETMTMTTKEDGGVMVETTPRDDDEFYDDFDMDTESDDFDVTEDAVAGDEVIAPLSDETEEEIVNNSEESEPEVEEETSEEETSEEEPEGEDVEVDEFDEETFDELGESYLRRCYENVKGYKTTQVRIDENLLKVDGIITFKSSAQKKTNFVFEAKEQKNKRFIFEGYNTQINKGKRAFKLNCSIQNKIVTPIALKYNYSGKNSLNESVKLTGVVKSKRK